MTPDEIKAKAAELASLYTAKSEGKTVQLKTNIGWLEWSGLGGPNMGSELSIWRIKPEPQRIWISGTAWTDSPVIAAALREVGQEAREFVEVLP
jgi:hypothetical protein